MFLVSRLFVGSAAILCLHTAPLVEVMHLSFALCLIYPTSHHSASHLSRISSVPRLICSMSHLFCVSPILRLICSVSHIFRVSRFRPFPNSQIMSRHQATSRNQSCLTRVREWGSCSRKMYIERAAHPVFSIMLLIRSDTQFNLFIDKIFAWPFDKDDMMRGLHVRRLNDEWTTWWEGNMMKGLDDEGTSWCGDYMVRGLHDEAIT